MGYESTDPPPHTHAVGGLPCGPQPPATTFVMWSWCLKGCFASASAVKGRLHRALVLLLPDGFAMLMRPNKAETAVHGCHCPGDMAVRMRKVMAIPRGWCSCVPLAFSVFI